MCMFKYIDCIEYVIIYIQIYQIYQKSAYTAYTKA